jgi:DNA-binding LytR/AlgR family response regulator
VVVSKYETTHSSNVEQLMQVDEKMQEKNKGLIETVVVKTGIKLHLIQISDIVCCQAYGDYVNLMTMRGTFLKEQTLKYFEEHLPKTQFLRVHRSFIVNIHAIESIERLGREQYMLLLKNKEKIKATPEGYKQLRKILNL